MLAKATGTEAVIPAHLSNLFILDVSYRSTCKINKKITNSIRLVRENR